MKMFFAEIPLTFKDEVAFIKKFKIRNKVLLIVLGLSISAMLIITIISYFSMTRFDKSSNMVYNFLTISAGESSQEALRNQTTLYLDTISVDRSELYNQNFAAINKSVLKYKDAVEDFHKNHEQYSGHTVPHAEQTKPEVYCEKYTLAPNVALTPDVEEQIRTLSNVEQTFRLELKNNASMLNSFIGTEKGVSYRYSNSNSFNRTYDARTRDWYIKAMEHPDEIVWTSAYEDTIRDKKTILVTCAAAFRDENGVLAGVVAVDVTVENLIEKILNAEIGENGYAFLLDEEGTIIAHKDYTAEGFEKKPLESTSISPTYRNALEKMISRQSGFEEIQIDAATKFISYHPLSSISWSVGVVIDEQEIMLPVHIMQKRLDVISDEARKDFQNTIMNIILQFIAVFAVLVVVVLVASLLLSNLLTKPIKVLADGARVVGSGDLDYVITIDSEDEIKDLADTFNTMTKNLKQFIQDLAHETQEKEKIASDLRIATDIQADMLPKIFPPFSNRDDLQIGAFMLPAKEVGGDFYDFFFLDEAQTKIALVIADVSGKGVPAALFMVIAKILIKNNKHLPINQVLEVVNDLLTIDNNSSMFVTTYYSVLDLETGEYTYSSAGHNPPLLYQKDSNTVSYLEMTKTPPLAIFPEKKFPSKTIQLQKGDMLLLYTDGITEAFDMESAMYGTERPLTFMKQHTELISEEFVELLYKDVKAFTKDAPQSDDITMLCCRYIGKE